MIGILGGSFDPIHYGHLQIALALYQQLHLDEVRFIPCKSPVTDKKIVANQHQRLTMLALALQYYPYFSIDERELHRLTPSYMIETLASLRLEYGNTPLGLIIGYDNLVRLNLWYQWTSLIDYAHLLVVPRPLQTKPCAEEIHVFVKKHLTLDSRLLMQQPSGLIFMAPIQTLPFSASDIRKAIADGHYPVDLLPTSVLDYIVKQKLYL
ncbi:nicotinate-nucleotide adenylyltransferase [Rickettsiella grylli]|uniref:nicotinate-nucleotide adenylyltransferase n=1 Tax=Rickettsiella grylli TaxID=59196 RepID=UPI000A7598BD|nr:nicotinate-nucleotide adenylyltransferase [Rickettsiella grylli]